jgi:cytochrome P450
VAAWRRGDLADEQLPIDLTTVLLREHGDDWDDDLWLRESLFYVVASANTTTHAVPHIFLELEHWLTAHPEDRARLDDDAFLRRAANEGLRFHGPVPALLRRVVRDTTLSTGRSFRAGDYVALHLGPANTDPAVYGDAAGDYDPRRDDLTSLQEHGLSFGSGEHMCPGRPLAIGMRGAGDDPSLPIGVIPQMLKELYRHGVRLDADDQPRLRDDTKAVRYATVPLVFDDL